MATRPGYSRKDTDHHGDVVASGSKTYELGAVDPKDGSYVDIQEGEREVITPPEYEEDAGDGFAKVHGPVETAKDLITTVIHVDDDPNISPYTFRLFFLGKFMNVL